MSEARAREEILARVRRVSSGRPANEIEAELSALPTGPAPPALAPDLATAFLAQVLKNGGSIACAADRSEAVRAIARYLFERYRTQKVVVANDPRLGAMPWREAGVLPRFGSARDGDHAALSFARLAVAETGAAVTFTGRANPAAHNLLADDHIVLVDVADLVPRLEEAWQRIRSLIAASGRPRGVNFLAGPSSTADVEATLVKGAHGPRHWHAILLGDIPADAEAEARRIAGQ